MASMGFALVATALFPAAAALSVQAPARRRLDGPLTCPTSVCDFICEPSECTLPSCTMLCSECCSPAATPPPPAPPAGSPRYVACGRTGRCDESDRWAAPSEKHEVRCCSDSRIDGWKKKDGCSVWSESDDDEMGGKCHHNKNFAQASTICEDAGARLCTRAELQGNCARGSGCGHDRDLIWSGTESEAAVPPPSAVPPPPSSAAPPPPSSAAPPPPSSAAPPPPSSAAPPPPRRMVPKSRRAHAATYGPNVRYHDNTPAEPILPADGACPGALA
ncbi:hypothetical protein EMIHUDRAFT_439025, partial [Emiliania huxleyi CCMP1516]|uniref:C-type lectin domain-containing protein n=2 Tax=Emiliania huxleyi TaxID=2903 RepID=A0A0D3I1Q5_EMIH1